MNAQATDSYDPTMFDVLDAVEDRHFWFRARGRVIAALARQVGGRLAPGYRVLEIGCGNGGVLRVLREACPGGKVYGMDLFSEGLRRAARRGGCPLVQGDAHRPPFGTPFDMIGLFDVLEHLPDDLGILRAIRAMLAPGGTLLMTVPAHPWLWSYFDEASHHCRRYTRAGLRDRLQEAGFDVEFLSEFFAPLLPLMWLGRRAAALRAALRPRGRERRDVQQMSADEFRIVPGVNGVLTHVLGLESRVIARRHAIPFGTSLIALARRPAEPADPGAADSGNAAATSHAVPAEPFEVRARASKFVVRALARIPRGEEKIRAEGRTTNGAHGSFVRVGFPSARAVGRAALGGF